MLEENTIILNKEIQEYCRTVTNVEGDNFVGIKFEVINGIREISINFPLGYRLPKNENEAREDILNLINVLKNNMYIDSNIDKATESKVLKTIKFPISSYITVILDYINRRDYYHEKEDIYQKSINGKISMKKTIKTIQPLRQDNGIIYPVFMVRTKNDTDKELITKISHFCVYESISKFGWLYRLKNVPKPILKNRNGMFQKILKGKLRTLNSDRLKVLFKAMIDVLNYVDNSENPEEFYFGTNDFEYVWENLINNIFGEKNKQDYFPRTYWKLRFNNNSINSALEPDTIMKYKNNFYVLDAKYYKYGQTFNRMHLPNSSSINKQITYGEYIYNNKLNGDMVDSKVYNAFLMPFDKTNKLLYSEKKEHLYFNIGTSISDWKNNDKEYEKVQGILVDIKSLMKMKVYHDNSALQALSQEIEKYFIK